MKKKGYLLRTSSERHIFSLVLKRLVVLKKCVYYHMSFAMPKVIENVKLIIIHFTVFVMQIIKTKRNIIVIMQMKNIIVTGVKIAKIHIVRRIIDV